MQRSCFREVYLDLKASNPKIDDVEEPNLMKDLFPYDQIPRLVLDYQDVPNNLPEDIFVTDTTFRDGQQGYAPFTAEQIVSLYDLMHRLGGPRGVIRFTEFFLYSATDREAVKKCLARGYKYPKVTGWIRASKGDFETLKKMKLEETGILASISDYHIFYKFQQSRSQVFEKYLSIVDECLKNGIVCRCHLEDITRADIDGVVVPFVQRVMRLSEKYGLPVKIRLCDTLGLGVPYSFASSPRSVPKMVWSMIHKAGVPSEWLEFHGHNDFNMAVANSTAAWLYGATSVNGTLLGIGERTGNAPLEAILVQMMELKHSNLGINTKVIHEVAEYYKKELDFKIPKYYPLVGENFNVTRAGIHADGLIKNEEVYLPFNTRKILGIPPSVAITKTSGLAGIVFWINNHLRLEGDDRVKKSDSSVKKIYDWVTEQYDNGRIIPISDNEMIDMIAQHLPPSSRNISKNVPHRV
jgi:isopropylmalate/homocitrate/citramalate synthase